MEELRAITEDLSPPPAVSIGVDETTMAHREGAILPISHRHENTKYVIVPPRYFPLLSICWLAVAIFMRVLRVRSRNELRKSANWPCLAAIKSKLTQGLFLRRTATRHLKKLFRGKRGEDANDRRIWMLSPRSDVLVLISS